MSDKATTPIVSEKVNPRTQCLTCGEFHSDSELKAVTIMYSLKIGKLSVEQSYKSEMSQCNKCLEKYGKPNKIWVRDFTFYGYKDRTEGFDFSSE